MAIENKRVIDLATESTSLAGDEYVLLDSNNTGTTKYRLSRLSGQIESVDEAVQAEAIARQNADEALEQDVSDLKDDLTYVAEGSESIEKELSWKWGYANADGTIVSSSRSKFALVNLRAGEQVTVGTQSTNITIIGSTTAESVSVGDQVTTIRKTTSENVFQTHSYIAESDINIVISIVASNYTLSFSKNTPTNVRLIATEDEIEVNKASIAGHENSIYDVVSAEKYLEIGNINSANGANYDSTTTIRSKSTLNSAISELVFNSDFYAFIYAYTVGGTFVGGYTGSGFSTTSSQRLRMYSPINLDLLSEYDYIYRIVFTKTSGGSVSLDEIEASFTIDNIKEAKSDLEKTYTVGADGDFESFTEMLVGLSSDNSKKIVYIMPGVYDIFEEMGGAEWMATVDTSKNWRAMSNVVPPNTKIIGIGDVVLSWNPTDAEIIDGDHAFLFSPLNLSGSCEIENISIECSNCRYGIHDETSGLAQFNGITRKLKNVQIIYTPSTYGAKYAYGAGHNKNSKYEFDNCLFSAGYGTSWSTHDWPATAMEKSTFEFHNCLFVNNVNGTPASIRFSSTDTVGRLDEVKINGCVFGAISFSTEGSADIKQGYTVQTMLCKAFDVSYTSHILEIDRIAPIEYLTIA